MSLLPLQQQPEVSTRIDSGRWRPRAGCPLCIPSGQPAKRGVAWRRQPRGKDANTCSSRSLKSDS